MTKETVWGTYSDHEYQWMADTNPEWQGVCTGPKNLHDALLAHGWADCTASTSNTTVLDYDNPIITDGATFYRTYYKNDALHTTLPIYLYLGYWRKSGSYSGGHMRVWVGSAIDALGQPVNGLSSTFYTSSTYQTTGVWWARAFFTSGDSYSGFSLPEMHARTADVDTTRAYLRHAMVSRTCDPQGNPTAEGFFAYVGGYSYNQLSFYGATPGAPSLEDANLSLQYDAPKVTFNPGGRLTMPPGVQQASRVQIILPDKIYTDENMVVAPVDSARWPSTLKATPNLTERTYIAAEAFSSYNHALVGGGTTSSNGRLCFRWE